MAEVYLNSKFVGMVENPSNFISEVKDLRRKGAISEEVSVYYDAEAQEVHLVCDAGRAQLTLIIVKEGKSLLTEKHLKRARRRRDNLARHDTAGSHRIS